MQSENKNNKNILTRFMTMEGSNNMFGPIGAKRTSLFGNMPGNYTTVNHGKNMLNTSGAKSEFGFLKG